jgi:GNAT superfamily N-acetyltransferase
MRSAFATFWEPIQRELSTEVVPFRWGEAYLDAEFLRRYDANFLWLFGTPADVTPEGLHAEAERVLASRGYEHLEVVVDDDGLGTDLAPGFAERGYACDHLVTMSFEGPTPLDTGSAELVSYEEIRPFAEEVNSREPWGAADPGLAALLAGYRAKIARVVDTSFVVVRTADGSIASACELYVRGDVAQVEDVNTLEEHRGKGLATVAVGRAIHEARVRGAETILLTADLADWPQRWYRSLGFVDLERFWGFVRWPERTRVEIPGHDPGLR